MKDGICEDCGLKDPIGQFVACPVCKPVPEGDDPKCFFLNVENAKCRVDGTSCPYIVDEDFDKCKKLDP